MLSASEWEIERGEREGDLEKEGEKEREGERKEKQIRGRDGRMKAINQASHRPRKHADMQKQIVRNSSGETDRQTERQTGKQIGGIDRQRKADRQVATHTVGPLTDTLLIPKI